MVAGTYAVRFQGADGAYGCGTVTLKNGEISGQDAGYSWKGHYRENQGFIEAELEATTDQQVLNIFMDFASVRMKFSGTVTDEGIHFRGFRQENPSQIVEALLEPVPV